MPLLKTSFVDKFKLPCLMGAAIMTGVAVYNLDPCLGVVSIAFWVFGLFILE